MKKPSPLPKFNTEDEEREFWATHDATDYFDFDDQAKMDLTRLRPSTKSITLRLPEWLIHSLKMLAHKKDVPYQSLMKIFLSEKVDEETVKPPKV